MTTRSCRGKTLALSLLLVLVANGCGEQKGGVSTYAKAVNVENPKEKARKVAEAKAKAKAEAKRKAEEEAKQKLEQKLDELTTAPPELPKDLEAACDQLVKAFDDFIRAVGDEKAVINWTQTRGKRLARLRATCEREYSVEEAACESAALLNAPAELGLDETRAEKPADEVTELAGRCRTKYGKKDITGAPK